MSKEKKTNAARLLDREGVSYELKHEIQSGVTFHQKGSYRKSDIRSRQTSGVYNPAMDTLNR